MVVYHGTTRRRAERICEVGFLPRKPSRRVWFAKGHGYATRRARQQARRAHDRAVVLTCEVNVAQLRERLGKRRVVYRGGILAIDGPVPPEVLRSHVGLFDQPSSPEELAAWVNDILRLKPYKGVSQRHAGLQRLSRWVTNRITSQPKSKLPPGEVLHMARQWLPEYFDGVEIDPATLHTHRKARRIRASAEEPGPVLDPLEEQALSLLEEGSPKRRIRGLELLAEVGDPDLFDWCVMFLGDRSTNVRVAALHLIRRCEDGEPETLEPLARSQNKRVRGAAIAALARHGGAEAAGWFARGLKDPEPCVRLETAAVLPELEPAGHRAVFELALHDPNPDVVRRAEKLTAGKGFRKATW